MSAEPDPRGPRRLRNLLGLLTRPKPVVGATPADAVYSENKWRLLRYRPRPASEGGLAFRTPVLLVPSLINRHYVLDLQPGRSFAAWLVARGHDVFIVDWGTPTDEDRYLSFDDIADRYILEGETSDGAVMFIPAEAVFAEIHAYHAEVVDHAMQRRVWIVSPTTMMAVLNTARAVMKDVETRRQVHVIKDELAKLGKDFARFDVRMRKLADHIRQAHDDAQQVQISSDKIVRRFTQIERVELESPGDVARLESGALDLDDVSVLPPVAPVPGTPDAGA